MQAQGTHCSCPIVTRMSVPKRLRQVVGQRVRELREHAGLRQDDLALAARVFGLLWNHSRIAALERGAKSINAEELVLLPAILGSALGRPVGMGELFNADGSIQLSRAVEIPARSLFEVLCGADPKPRIVCQDASEMRLGPASECDERACRGLGVDADTYATVCDQLWGHILSVERDIRLRAVTGVSPASLAAHRGRVTRDLLAEAREAL